VTAPPATIVAIPAKDEADEIGPCLQALAGQRGPAPHGAVLCLNNCSDGSAATVQQLAPSLPFPVHVLEVQLAGERACAGVARRIAMDRAADLVGPDGIILTTDADGRVAPDWLAHNLAALARGADAVAGRAEIEPNGAKLIPAHLHEIDARECAYAALLDEIASLLDPDPADPWPRHDEHSGASIAVTVAAYRRSGGMPPSALGEDRAFFDALRRVDARIRHAPEVRVTVSARIVGRAAGGMADTIRRRIERVDPLLDDRLEGVPDAVRRAMLRAALRHAWHAPCAPRAGMAARLRLPTHEVADLLSAGTFGVAWAATEERSPVLQRQRVTLADLPLQTARALRLRNALRTAEALNPGDPADTTLLDAAD
jgi:Glycosyl transferase family 2